MLAITVYFLEHDPALIERRLHVGPAAERERSQQIIQTVASALTCAVFIVPGLDHRFGWSPQLDPRWPIGGDAMAAAGFLMMFLAFRENTHAAATVGVEQGQRVVSSGPYRVVRHPMYAGAVLLFLATPVALGSLWGLIPATALVGVIAVRLLDEERYLAAHLPGYTSYCETVTTRLLPGVW